MKFIPEQNFPTYKIISTDDDVLGNLTYNPNTGRYLYDNAAFEYSQLTQGQIYHIYEKLVELNNA